MIQVESIDSVPPTESVEKNNKKNKPKTKLYFRRYLVLAILSLALFANGEVWMTFGSVEEESAKYFNRPRSDIVWFSNIFLVAYAVEAIPCTFMPKIIGLRWTIMSGLSLNLLGSIFRFIGTSGNFKPLSRFIVCMIGNLWFGLAQGFLLNIPSLVSAVWFGENERSVSTAIAYMSNALGVGLGFLDIFLLAANQDTPTAAHGFLHLSIFEFVLCLVLFLLSIPIVIEKPRTPPSFSQHHKSQIEENVSFLAEMKSMAVTMLKLLVQPFPSSLLLIFASNYAAYVVMFSFLSVMTSDLVTDTNDLTGYIGSVGIILGGIFTVIVGYIMFKTQNKYNRKIALIINMICIPPLIAVLNLGATEALTSSLSFVFFAIYFCFCPVYISVGCEILADVTYPIDPNVTSNAGLILGNILGASINYTFMLISGRTKHFALLGLIIAFYSINSLAFLFVKYKNARKLAEKE